jgi:ABC-2 type transport system ATP-binding protein
LRKTGEGTFQMIEARGLSKRYGRKVAVDDLSFTVRPGHVTGFLGPNGAGKTTTMRMILGLDRPTAGSVTVNGKPFTGLFSAMREVGALLDAAAVHGGRSARSHLLCLAQTNAIPPRPCSATRRSSCSTSRSTASTRKGSAGSGC